MNEIDKAVEELKDLYKQVESKKKQIRDLQTKQKEKWNKQSNHHTTNIR